MAGASNSSIGGFLLSLTRDEVSNINPAEFFKLVEYVVLHEDKVVSVDSPLSAVHEAICEWCCGSFHHWDIIEQSPWFLDPVTGKADIHRFVARIRQKVSAQRRVEDQLQSITEDLVAELFEED
jgi:hypothetical protein